ncbi:MAG: prepilin-type N-terminal cleavage/methylation domain-containing protein [Gammaproteobacteria bacterium]|nr:prepilin-type N-terminal cleavage/methylation domain-containing protein [Gammaproteobacteria bacterium]
MTNYEKTGFTVLECLAALSILTILAMIAHNIGAPMIREHRVIAATNSVAGLIREARANAITDGNRLICDGERGCSSFKRTRLLIEGRDKNQNSALEDHEIQHYLQLPNNTWLEWKRFRGKHLVYSNRGVTRFQNGHFLICNGSSGRKIIMNWIGRTRIEKAGSECESN